MNTLPQRWVRNNVQEKRRTLRSASLFLGTGGKLDCLRNKWILWPCSAGVYSQWVGSWRKHLLILLAVGHCPERQCAGMKGSSQLPWVQQQRGSARAVGKQCPAHPVLLWPRRTAANAVCETMKAALRWHLVQKEGKRTGLYNSIVCSACLTAAQCPLQRRSLCKADSVQPENSWVKPIQCWLFECIFLSYVWHSQKQRQARLFKMYFLVKITLSTSMTATIPNPTYQHSSLI